MKVIKPIILNLVLSSVVFGQRAEQPKSENYPKNIFQNPLEITNYLAGNFGELRSNHFHAGLDIKTQQREGLKVKAVGDGYISRINVSPTGYGNALYIDHPNGYTSVYAHLREFTPELQAYVRKQQYANETFKIELHPKPNEIPVKMGDLIALSGNSGGSGGPHLHFEIRDTKSEEPINPFYFGFDIPDTRKPSILGLYAYPIYGDINQKTSRVVVANGGTLSASGAIGFGVKAYDKHNGAENNNGVHQINIYVNDEPIYTFTSNRFSFDEARAINSVCDYGDIQKNNSWVYQGFVKDGNPIRMYSNLKNNGILEVEEGKSYKVKIEVSDYAGNLSTQSFTVNGKPYIDSAKLPETNPIFWNKENHFKNQGIEIFFPKNIFYEDFDLTYKFQNGKHWVGDYYMPVHQSYTLVIEPTVEIPTAQLDKAVIVREYQKRGGWKKDYLTTELKNGKLVANPKDFGVFSVMIDNTKPTITPLNIKSDSQFTQSNGIIKFTINDAHSGIKDYKAYIDGKWVLAEYDQKIKRLTINLNQEQISVGDHQLELNVKDEKNNTATYSTTFKKIS
ncbi:M23 family metallopeptidase [Empedobacter brevis]|uniref:M23 family metallopeptidase n=1 Tax=Empedobacter brevis TaxID=247 RepID=UPI0028D2C347|nr:M23 family metallopeptidase [Empedobacter brevis]